MSCLTITLHKQLPWQKDSQWVNKQKKNCFMDYLNLSFKDVFTDINFWVSKAQKQPKRSPNSAEARKMETQQARAEFLLLHLLALQMYIP